MYMNCSIEKTILFRVDANSAIGCGHLMRCLALAQACSDKQLKTIFALSSSSREASENKALHGFNICFVTAYPGSLQDSRETIQLAVQNNASWIVIDGYHFDETYHQKVKESGIRILCIDDCSQMAFYYADIILNQNFHADEGQYQNRSPHTQLLLGSRYVLLRNEFLKLTDRTRNIPDQGRRILITMGGSDLQNITLTVVKWISELCLPDLIADVVLGPSNLYFPEIRNYLNQQPGLFRIHRNVNNMSGLMANADLAISSAGTTSWEMAFMGVPSLLIVIAENQRPIAEKLHSLGASIYLGWHEEITSGIVQQKVLELIRSPEQREKMMQIGQGIVDGKGRERVVEEITKSRIALRPADESDCRMIWEWANDEIVREASFSTEIISWDRHVEWFQTKLKDSGCEIYIAHNEDGRQLGQIRFEMDHNDAVISISLDPACRNKGYGRQIIAMGTQMILARRNVEQVRAMVKKSNIASLRAFENALFEKEGMDEFLGEHSFRLVYRKNDRGKHAYHH